MTEPLGIASIAGTLHAKGHICDLIFLSEEQDFQSYIQKTNPDLIGFSLITGDVNRKFKIMQEIKNNFGILIIAGGPHATLYADDLLKKDFIDICCIGDGELSLLGLLDKIDSKNDVYNIKNIYYKRDGKVIKNDLFLTDIDTLDKPDRSIFFKYEFLRNTPIKRFITSYGCPYTCNFCWNEQYLNKFKNYGKYYRRKNCDKIIKEVQEVIKTASNTKRVHFHDDIFNLPNSWVEEFCGKYEKALPDFPWSCTVRVDLLNENLIKKMAKAGCVSVSIGVETADEEKRMQFLGKKIKNKQYIENCRLLNKYHIKIMSSIMSNLSAEKIEDTIDTLKFNRRLGVYAMRSAMLTVWKGQETFNKCIRNKIPLIPVDESGLSFLINNRNLYSIRKLSCICNFLYKSGLLYFWKFFISLPLPLSFFRLFRLFDGYLEMRYLGMGLIDGIKYYRKTAKEYFFYQKAR